MIAAVVAGARTGGRCGAAGARGVATLVALAALAIVAAPADAATITVTRVDDPPLGDTSGCSLRQAVQAANTNAGVGACAAGEASLDTVRLPDSVFLTTAGLDDTNVAGDIDVLGGGPLAIVGADAPRTIRQLSGDRVLNVVAGSLALERVIVTGGAALGPAVDGYGGGILVREGAQLTLTETTVRANAAVQAGGIANGTREAGSTIGGTVRIFSSTVSGNTATSNAIGAMGGGGIGNVNGTLSIVNSTVSGNTSIGSRGGGVYNEGITVTSAVDIVNSTIADNGGFGGDDNLHNSGNGAPAPMRLRSTIVAAARTGGNCGSSGGGGFTSLGFNLADDDGCGLTAPTDRPSTDPLLGALADNGGPTRTHALPAGSPAIDGGTGDTALPGIGALGADQRGLLRPVDLAGSPNAAGGDGADIGAFEFQPPPPAVLPPDTAVALAIARGRLGVGRRGVARLPVACPRTEASPPCRGTVTLLARARIGPGQRPRRVILARASFSIDAGRATRLRLALSPSRLALLRARPAARRAVAVAIVRDAAGNRATVRAPLLLVPPA